MLSSLFILILAVSLDAFFAGIAYGGKKVRIPIVSKLIISSFSVIYTLISIWLGSTISKFMPIYISKYIGTVLLICIALYSLVFCFIRKKRDDMHLLKCTNSESTKVEETNCVEELQNKNSDIISSTFNTESNPYENEKKLFRYILKKPGITMKVIENPSVGDIDNSGKISVLEAVILGIALNIDSIGTGIGSALTGLTSPLIAIATGFSQLFMLCLGEELGVKAIQLFNINKTLLALLPGLSLMTLAILRLF